MSASTCGSSASASPCRIAGEGRASRRIREALDLGTGTAQRHLLLRRETLRAERRGEREGADEREAKRGHRARL
jgi:hypothetical protein